MRINPENRLLKRTRRKENQLQVSIINTSFITKASSCLSCELPLYPHRHCVVLSSSRDSRYIRYKYGPCISDSCSVINKLHGILSLPYYSPLEYFLSRKISKTISQHFVRHFLKRLVLIPFRAAQKRGLRFQNGRRQLCKVTFFTSTSASN